MGDNNHSPTAGETFVLVHGAFHGGWCWERVTRALQQQGHSVYALTLTGLGERSHLLSENVNLSTHIDDVISEIRWKDLDNIILCGHSYGGMVVTGVAERVPEKIKAIVYLDAFIPQDGQSAALICTGGQLPAELVAIPPLPAEHFAVNEADCAWVDSKMTPQPAASYNEKISVSGALSKIAKKYYVRATGYESPFFDEAYERVAQDSKWSVSTMTCGHDLMLDAPDEVTTFLLHTAADS